MSDERSDDPIDEPQGLSDTTTDADTGAAPPASDGRETTVEELERTVANERQHSATLRSSVDELRFKIDVLEQSYAKQLEDARLRTEAAEKKIADQQARMTELDSAHQDAMQSLAEAQTELERLADYDQPRKHPASASGQRITAMPHNGPESRFTITGTIDELMDDVKWLRKRQPADDEEEIQLEAEEDADEKSPLEEMIAPDWLFAHKDDDKGES